MDTRIPPRSRALQRAPADAAAPLCRRPAPLTPALPASAYRDPLTTLLAFEARSCRGCAHARRYLAFGQPMWLCSKGKPYGQRCKRYLADTPTSPTTPATERPQ